MALIENWNEELTEGFRKKVLQFQHRLDSTGLFTDDALIELLDNHPKHLLDVNTMGDSDHPIYPNRFRTGDVRDIPASTVLEAAKAGRIWINLRHAMNVFPEYKKALDDIYAELADLTGMKFHNPKGGILVSSPISKTPYHFDKTEVVLWHIRGQKRIYVYPLEDKFISEELIESGLTKAADDDLPYDKSFDDDAIVVDLEPGMAVTWPFNSPHRVDNRSFCVSITTEYTTPKTFEKNSNLVLNAALRQKFGMDPSYANDGVAARAVKSVFGKVLKQTGGAPKNDYKDMVTFTLDANAPDYVVDVEPFERNF